MKRLMTAAGLMFASTAAVAGSLGDVSDVPATHVKSEKELSGFLGLGAQPPLPEWGAMISSGRKFMLDQWWVAAMPGIAIFVVSLGFNLLGDGLRDVLDPKAEGQ